MTPVTRCNQRRLTGVAMVPDFDNFDGSTLPTDDGRFDPGTSWIQIRGSPCVDPKFFHDCAESLETADYKIRSKETLIASSPSANSTKQGGGAVPQHTLQAVYWRSSGADTGPHGVHAPQRTGVPQASFTATPRSAFAAALRFKGITEKMLAQPLLPFCALSRAASYHVALVVAQRAGCLL